MAIPTMLMHQKRWLAIFFLAVYAIFVLTAAVIMEAKLKFSTSAIEGINLLNGVISEEITRKLIVNAVKQILITGPALPIRSDIYESEGVRLEVKRADFGVCAVLICAAQHSLDPLELKEILDGHKINSKTTSQLIESYEKFKDELSNRLSKYGTTDIPTLVDVDYEIQQHTIPSGDTVFKLTFKGFDHERETVIETVVCNQEELQLLISRLKDIERHCERVSRPE